MTENCQGKLHHKECKKSKGAKIYTSTRKELESEKFLKDFLQTIYKTKYAKKKI